MPAHRAPKRTARDRRSRISAARSNPRLVWLLVGLAILAGELAAIFIIRTSKANPPVEVAPPQAFNMIQQGAFILDVRTQAEWEQVHISGSKLIPLDQLGERLSELPRDADIIVVCATGHRSATGAALLSQSGFRRVFSMNGGMQAWMEADYPIEQGVLTPVP
jgi:rhodanese-related sulfurtransferase